MNCHMENTAAIMMMMLMTFVLITLLSISDLNVYMSRMQLKQCVKNLRMCAKPAIHSDRF